MKLITKLALSVIAWLVAIAAAAAALEVTFGRARPGLVPMASTPMLVPALVALWWPHRPWPWWIREALWAAGVVLLLIVYVVSGIDVVRPRLSDWRVGFAAFFGGISALRIAVWAFRRSRRTEL